MQLHRPPAGRVRRTVEGQARRWHGLPALPGRALLPPRLTAGATSRPAAACLGMTAAGREPGKRYDFRSGWKWRTKTRPAVLARDGNRCRYCGGMATEADHLVRVQDNGDHHALSNLVAACRSCNAKRNGVRSAGPATVFSSGTT